MNALTHNLSEKLYQTASDRLFQLASDCGKRIRKLNQPGFELAIDHKGSAFVVTLKAREGKPLAMVSTGCYVSVTIHQQGPKKVLRVFESTKISGTYADTINRRNGIGALQALAAVLHGGVEGFEFAD